MAPRIDQLTLDHGSCVVVELDDLAAALAALPAGEQDRAAQLSEIRRRDFITGRTALHHALAAAAADHSAPILSDDRGAPVLPAGWVGSLSHKGAVGVALIAPAGRGHIGIDLERAIASRQDIASHILTPREQASVPDRGRAVTQRFSIKEAIYKAIDPYVRRYVGFLEVELDIGETIAVTTELPFAIEATCRERDGHWLATARARPR